MGLTPERARSGPLTELESLKRKLRAICEQQAPTSLFGRGDDPAYEYWGGAKASAPSADSLVWLERMAERGLTAPSWPKELGGAGFSPEEAQLVDVVLQELDLPRPLVGFGLDMIGPTLLRFGSEAHKRKHLPDIARGAVRWCQGYSEPNAGSDLASLQTRAVLDGETLVLNGQKLWTSYGDLSDWMFMLVRTAPEKHRGITFLLVDLASPGIELRPIRLISGASPFTETFFNDVRVPVDNVVGGLNAGWTVAKSLLAFERNMIADMFGNLAPRDALLRVAREYVGPRDGKLSDPLARDRIAQWMMDHTCFQNTVSRIRDAERAGLMPGPEASLLKIYGTELNQRREEIALSLRGPQCLGADGPGFSGSELDATRAWLRSRGNTIEGGTSEIQLNIIAKQVLGLPE